MIAAADIARALFLDDRPVMRVGLIDRGVVGERVANDDDAGAVREGVDPFGQQFLARLGRSGGFARLEPIVDEHVRHDVAGEGIVGAVERALDLALELFEVAGVGGEPHPVGSQSLGVVVLHELSSVQSFLGLSIRAQSSKIIAPIPQKPINPLVATHPFLIKEIALQAGMSEATVDRVLNKRGGVRRHTAERVKQAIRELHGQSEQAGLQGASSSSMSSCRRRTAFPKPCGWRSKRKCRRCGRRSSVLAITSARSCALLILRRSSTGSARAERMASFSKRRTSPRSPRRSTVSLRAEFRSSRSSPTSPTAVARPTSAWTTAPPARRPPTSLANGLAARRRRSSRP